MAGEVGINKLCRDQSSMLAAGFNSGVDALDSGVTGLSVNFCSMISLLLFSPNGMARDMMTEGPIVQIFKWIFGSKISQ